MNDIRQGTCPLCGHNEIIEAKPRAHAGSGSNGELYLAKALAPGAFAAGPVGPLWSYTCRRCDFTQLFARGAVSLPIGDEHGTRAILGPPVAGPFR